MKIALVTRSNLPDWEVDDRPLHAAFADLGVELCHPAWDDRDFDWTACDAALMRTTWDYQDRRDEFLAWARRVAAAIPLYNPLPVIRWNTDKTYLRDLQSRGVTTIPTVWLNAGTTVDVGSALAARGWKRAFLKPAIGATARETLRFQTDRAGIEQAERHIARLLPTEDLLLQPYLPSVERVGELSLIFIDRQFSHAVRKVPVPGDYRVQDDFGASDEPARVNANLVEMALDIVNTVQHDLLYARVDFLRDEHDRLCVSELELVEPSLFFRHCPEAAPRLAAALLARLSCR
ncbi:MAG: hypothetical protein PVI86_18375 [Phycisphaerae bacterium]|jgi:glutathione synthase/RimK-type ligase-like ATP-grasp enzyme